MFKNNTELDFYELKKVGFGRLHPERISVFLLAALVYSGIMTAISISAIASSIYITNSTWKSVARIELLALLIQLFITVFFVKGKNAIKFQKLQALLLNIVSIKISIEFYQVFFLACEDKFAPSFIVNTGSIALFGGFILLISSTIRAIYRVKQGEFRRGGRLLFNFHQSKVYMSIPALFGVVMLGGTFARSLSHTSNMYGQMTGLIIMLFICTVIQYGMSLAWPEIFLLTYCKFRFETFNIEAIEKLGKKV
jgi:hypothetical protein